MASARPAARLAADLLRLTPRRPTPLLVPTPQPTTTTVSTLCRSFTIRTRFLHNGTFFTPTPTPPNPKPPKHDASRGPKDQRTRTPPRQARAAPTSLAVGAGVAVLASYLYNRDRERDSKSKTKTNLDSSSRTDRDDRDRAKDPDPDKEPPPPSPEPETSQQPDDITAKEDTREPLSLPRYHLSEIRSQHSSTSSSPWVTYADKVYDITTWVGAHPGGDVILRAAGGPIEPYWDIFTIHKTSPYVRDILEQFCVGYILLDDLDPVTKRPKMEEVEDPFEKDPVRDERLITHTAKPRNAETPSDLVGAEFKTGEDVFYVRHHMWVPVVDVEDLKKGGKKFVLNVELPDGETRGYTLKELKERFRRHKVTATLQCSGNRRNDMTRHAGKTNGLQWGVGAISNAEWEGVLLRDVLKDAGLKVADPSTATAVVQPPSAPSSSTSDEELTSQKDLHVQFSALEAYGASIPLSKALDPTGDVLLAFGMNGRALPRDHGFPLRAIVPGHVAARSVKWLNKIVVSDEESPSQWQRRDYKSFGPNEGANPDWERARSIQEMPVTSAITGVWVGSDCFKNKKKEGKQEQEEGNGKKTVDLAGVDGQKVGCTKTTTTGTTTTGTTATPSSSPETKPNKIPISMQGYAYSGGGRAIARVDVSLDNGRTWDQAELIDDCSNPATPCYGNKTWTWKRWKYSGNLPPSVLPSSASSSPSSTFSSSKPASEEDKKCTTLIVKAIDEAYNTQPESHAGIYNVRGNLATAWHRVRICPECVACPDGGKGVKWVTGKVIGCGFEKEVEEAREKGEKKKKKEEGESSAVGTAAGK
ncbi:Oxidoreductase, molybdopterin-binding domain-containing protein [Neurospora tetraspora]|uniref:Nitrate reductase [NADPH] n=1 Tax=Neurospora tetraspora TaxID=94610 RepID=A0AAE0JH51_9PEZI|nr:Oxidoreductase, molybdopterin-binding domain-containing protein [Neurospora tetraspora]